MLHMNTCRQFLLELVIVLQHLLVQLHNALADSEKVKWDVT
jgi:hypothetical protein